VKVTPLAHWRFDRKLRGINWFQAAYRTPVVISMVVAGIAWKWLYAENGLLKSAALAGLGGRWNSYFIQPQLGDLQHYVVDSVEGLNGV